MMYYAQSMLTDSLLCPLPLLKENWQVDPRLLVFVVDGKKAVTALCIRLKRVTAGSPELSEGFSSVQKKKDLVQCSLAASS